MCGSDDDDEDYGVYLGATAENTLCIETTLTHLNQLEGGDGQIFSRRLDMDNYRQFLECDADGCPKHCSWANDKLKALQDKMDVLTFCNDGDCPLMPKKGIEWVRFTVGEKLVYAELIRCQFEPATDPETGKMVRYDYDEFGNRYYSDDGRHCYWRILFSVTQPRYIEG